MNQVHVIRHKHYTEGQSVRQIAHEMGLNRRTVKKYLGQSEPRRQERAQRPRPVMERLTPRIDRLLEEWKSRTTPKHRITSVRVHRQLIEEGLQVGERTVREYLAEKRRAAAEVYIPLVHRPGDEAQVDFFEVSVDVDGVRKKVWKLLLRLMYSKRDFVWLYERCNQVSFFDGHVRAFAALGGVPHRAVYDNLTSAVKRLLGVGGRELNDRFKALASHYLYEPCFARPGEGHDKGGVEGRGKTIRLQHLTPIVAGKTLAGIATALQTELDAAWQRAHNPEGRLLSDLFEEERGRLLPLPTEPFEVRRPQPVSVSKSATVRLETAVYSVPSSWARLDATAYSGVEDVRFVCRGEVHVHALQPRGGTSIRYRDYLPELARKPQAVRQVAAELVAELGEPYGRLWTLLEQSHGGLKAARLLAGVLGALQDHGESVVNPALLDALARGSFQREEGALLSLAVHLPARPVLEAACVPPALRLYEVSSGCAADYDVLLAGGAL
jgi:transposase